MLYMPEISVIIITYNEEKNIGRCLTSVERIADEIIVVDSFSTDNTAEICNSFRVNFFQTIFRGYIEQKNYALSLASCPVVLSLDADEALSPELERSIVGVKNNWKYDGYYFNRLNKYCGRWMRYTSRYPDRKLRLWDRTRGRFGGTNPHDRVLMDKGSRVSFLKGDIEHYHYDTLYEHVKQVNRFTDIAARAYYEKGIRSNYLKIIVHPLWRFFREFIIRRGFMDGFRGLAMSAVVSFESFLKYAKLRQMYRYDNKDKPG